jgi:NADH-quinone oxidoreductase subunit G
LPPFGKGRFGGILQNNIVIILELLIEMVTIFIDNKPYKVKEGQNLLHACLSLGFNLPYFCWHPALGSVGACRQCAVKQFKDEHDTRGRIVMSCMTPAADGLRISIDDPEVLKFRASVIEWLMLNHPHDCPVCDEGGECHLQDMTVMTGHNYRRTRFKKRTYRNQYLGPFINHEMNRCIQCYRCVRFYNEYAGGRDFNVFSAHDHVYFGRHQEGVLGSEFSGNLIEICPTGVFTDKTLKKHFTRKWDLQTAPSVCVHCGVGCNILPGERYGKLRRIRNRYNGQVNGYFLCDRGRFGYEFVNGAQRIRNVLIRKNTASREIALEHVTDFLHFGARVIGIGSPRASLEANFALRTLVREENFYLGLSAQDYHLVSELVNIMLMSPARSPSLHEVTTCDSVFVLGEDVTNVAPLLDLALRQSVRQKPMKLIDRLNIPRWHDQAVRNAIQDKKGPVFVAAPSATKLDDIATRTYYAAPDELARLGFAIANILNPAAPPVTEAPEEIMLLAETIARELREADRPLIVSGISYRSEAIIKAAANIAWALQKNGRPAAHYYIVPECNTLGLGLLGGKSLDTLFQEAQHDDIETAIILENDLYRRVGKQPLDDFFARVKHVIAIDSITTLTTEMAEVVLPAGTFAESSGTLVNSEGRAQRFYKVFQSEDSIQESWKWILDMMGAAEEPESQQWLSFDDITASLAQSQPFFSQVVDIAPPASFRVAGMKIPRQPHRYSGRTAMHANVSIHEPEQPGDHDTPFAFTMEGYQGIPPSPLVTRFWAPGWNSVQAVNKFQSEIGGPLHGGDPGRRLIEPDSTHDISFFDEVPSAFKPDPDKLMIIPIYHIFGSEELSILSPGIAELSPKPYLGLSPDVMRNMQINGGEVIDLSLSGVVLTLPVKCITLPVGTAGLPTGLSGLQGIGLPAWGKISKHKIMERQNE